MGRYKRVQFLGYAIPSIPHTLADIGDGPGFIEGRYVGIDPPEADIEARIAMIIRSVRKTMASGAVADSPSTLKIFMTPEFLIRGTSGAYPNHPPTIDYFDEFRRQFAERVAGPQYEGWLFVIGTVVNTVGYVKGQDPGLDFRARVREQLAMAIADAWQYANRNHDVRLAAFITCVMHLYTNYCHDHPTYQVTDKCYVVAGGAPDPDYPEGLSIEKKFMSNEDFILNLQTNAYAEEQVGFPPINEHDGENKQKAFDPLSIFTIKGIKFGLEVCLDHLAGRLRRNRQPETELVQIHLVPSCGVQIVQPSIIAGPGGLVFNCDGEYSNFMMLSPPGNGESLWTGAASQRAHTQLTQVVMPCGGGVNPRKNAVLRKPRARVQTVSFRDAAAAELFAYGPGEVHVYTPLAVPPPVTRS
jgi:hypothetical protein